MTSLIASFIIVIQIVLYAIAFVIVANGVVWVLKDNEVEEFVLNRKA